MPTMHAASLQPCHGASAITYKHHSAFSHGTIIQRYCSNGNLNSQSPILKSSSQGSQAKVLRLVLLQQTQAVAFDERLLLSLTLSYMQPSASLIWFVLCIHSQDKLPIYLHGLTVSLPM